MQKLKSEKPNLKKHWNTGHCIMQRKYIASSAEWLSRVHAPKANKMAEIKEQIP